MLIKLEKTGWLLAAAGTLGFTALVSAQSYPYTPQAPAAPAATAPTPYTVQGQAITSKTSSPYSSQGTTVQSPASPYQSGSGTPAASSDSTPRPFTRLSEMKRGAAPLPPPGGTGSSAAGSSTPPAEVTAPAMPVLKGPSTTPPWGSGNPTPV